MNCEVPWNVWISGLYTLGMEELSNWLAWMATSTDSNKSLVMEAIVTKDLWIWHAFIRLSSSLNDINVIDHRTFMVNYFCNVAPHAKFTMNYHAYHMCYLLVNGIYHDWIDYEKTISKPQGEMKMVHKNARRGL